MINICWSKSGVIDNKSEFEDFENLEDFVSWVRSFEGQYKTIVVSCKKEK